MGVVFFGHGGLDPVDAKDMEWVAIPEGTTLQFYADAGQTLRTGQVTWSNYAANLDQPWPALDSSRVTYNLALAALSAQEQHEIDVVGSDFPHTIVMIGRDLPSAQLCTGDSTTCPSDPRMVAGTVDGPREHGCDGLLATYKGQELHWVACTGLDGFSPETQEAITAARGSAPEEVRHGEDPDSALAGALAFLRDEPAGFEAWFDSLDQGEKDKLLADPAVKAWSDGRTFTTTDWNPTPESFAEVASLNQPYVKGLGEDDTGTWQVAGFMVMLGDGHEYEAWAQQQPDYASGTFAVERATFGAGKLVFSGVPPVHQGSVESAVGEFSEKKVVFE